MNAREESAMTTFRVLRLAAAVGAACAAAAAIDVGAAEPAALTALAAKAPARRGRPATSAA
jgi:hypothetical protein